MESFNIVIPTRNRAEETSRLLSYLRKELGITEKIIICDQSDDKGERLSKSIIDSDLKDTNHFYSEKRGPSSARNEGALCTDCDWIIFLDDDVFPMKGIVSSIGKFIDENPWVDAVAMTVKYQTEWEKYKKNPVSWLKNIENDPKYFYPIYHTGNSIMKITASSNYNYSKMTIGFPSGAFVIKRNVFFGVGGFDENCDTFEDRDLGLRLWYYGYRVIFDPHSFVFHLRAKHGGQRPIWDFKLKSPEPQIGLMYLLMLWFNPDALRAVLFNHIVRLLRRKRNWIRPWYILYKLLMLPNWTREARKRFETGPILIQQPVPRDVLNKESSHLHN